VVTTLVGVTTAADFQCADDLSIVQGQYYVESVCCSEGHSPCLTVSGLKTRWPMSCRSPSCYRAVIEMNRSCFDYLHSPQAAFQKEARENLENASKQCVLYKTNAPDASGPYPRADAAPRRQIVINATAATVHDICGAEIVNDPVGANGQGASTTTLVAPEGLAVQLDFRALYMPSPGDQLTIKESDKDGEQLVQLKGRIASMDPQAYRTSLPSKSRGIRSQGSQMYVEYLAIENLAIFPNAFRARVSCVCKADADCGHGTCNGLPDAGRCKCNPGYSGDVCDKNVCDDKDYCGDQGLCHAGLCYCTGNYTLNQYGKCTVPPPTGPRGQPSAFTCRDGYTNKPLCDQAPVTFTVSGALANGTADEPNGGYKENGTHYNNKRVYVHATNNTVFVRWMGDGWEMQYLNPTAHNKWACITQPGIQAYCGMNNTAGTFKSKTECEDSCGAATAPPQSHDGYLRGKRPIAVRRLESRLRSSNSAPPQEPIKEQLFYYNPQDTEAPPTKGWLRDGQQPFTTSVPTITYA
jgi:hypothetical protein